MVLTESEEELMIVSEEIEDTLRSGCNTKFNKDKTKMVVVGRYCNRKVTVQERNMENVDEFTYLSGKTTK